MNNIITIIQIIISISLIGLILIQAQGTGLGRAFGGESFYYSKRGVEKVVMYLTIVLSFLFFVVSILNVLFN